MNLLHTKEEDVKRELDTDTGLTNEFGLVPQHVRGSASGFNVDLMTSDAYEK